MKGYQSLMKMTIAQHGMNESLDYLNKLGKKVPLVRQKVLNTLANVHTRTAKKIVSSDFINRNKYTVNTIRTKPATLSPLSTSASGSLEKYMKIQETGGKVKNKGVALASARVSEDFHRLTTGGNRAVMHRTAVKVKNKRELIAAIRDSSRGNRPIIATLSGQRGLFKVVGKGKNAKLRMVSNIEKSHFILKKRPWVAPSMRFVQKNGNKIVEREMVRVLRVGFVSR